jgi:hypothetical protein
VQGRSTNLAPQWRGRAEGDGDYRYSGLELQRILRAIPATIVKRGDIQMAPQQYSAFDTLRANVDDVIAHVVSAQVSCCVPRRRCLSRILSRNASGEIVRDQERPAHSAETQPWANSPRAGRSAARGTGADAARDRAQTGIHHNCSPA